MEKLYAVLEMILNSRESYVDVYIGIARFAVPFFVLLVLIRCAVPLITFRREPEIWAWLKMPDKTQVPVTH